MKNFKIDHVTFYVSNYKESSEFYNLVFGLKEKETGLIEGLPWGILGDKDKFFLCLYEVSDPNLSKKIEQSPFKHFGLYTPDFDSFVEKIKREGLKYLYDGVYEYPKSRSLYIVDPDGYQIEVTDAFGGGL
jgi:lactoylglutathione lyase